MSDKMTEMKKDAHSGTVRIGIIVASYVVFYLLSGTIFAIGDKSSVAFWIILIVSCWFGSRFFKGRLLNEANSIFGYVIVFLVGALTGMFVAPYYIGDKIAKKVLQSYLHEAINDVIEENGKTVKKSETSQQNTNYTAGKNNTDVKKSQVRTEAINVKYESTEELSRIEDILSEYVNEIPLPCDLPGIPASANRNSPERTAEFKKKKLPCGRIYGCTTYGEVYNLNLEIVKEINRRYRNN